MTVVHEGRVAITGGDLKIASLVFDSIVPLHTAGEVPPEILCPQIDIAQNYNLEELMKKVIAKSVALGRDSVAREAVHVLHNLMAMACHANLRQVGVESVPLFHSTPSFDRFGEPGSNEAVEVKFVRAPIIDTDAISWEHILDVRSDPDFRKKVRRFRLLLEDEYAGKDQSYIRDSILQKIDDYEAACRRNGLSLIVSSLAKTLDSKSLLGTLGITAVGILTGNPNVAGLGVLSGIVIELGNISLHVAEKRLEFESRRQNSEIALLLDAKRYSKAR